MVEIVDPNPDPSVVKEVVCRLCGVRLSFVPNEVEWQKHYDYTGGSDMDGYIKCPNCGSSVNVTNIARR